MSVARRAAGGSMFVAGYIEGSWPNPWAWTFTEAATAPSEESWRVVFESEVAAQSLVLLDASAAAATTTTNPGTVTHTQAVLVRFEGGAVCLAAEPTISGRFEVSTGEQAAAEYLDDMATRGHLRQFLRRR